MIGRRPAAALRAAFRSPRAARTARPRSRRRSGRRGLRRDFRAGDRRGATRATAAATRPHAPRAARTRRRSAPAACERHARSRHPCVRPRQSAGPWPSGPHSPSRTRRCAGAFVHLRPVRRSLDGTSSARSPPKLSEVTRPSATNSASPSSTWERRSPLVSISSSKNDAPCSLMQSASNCARGLGCAAASCGDSDVQTLA